MTVNFGQYMLGDNLSALEKMPNNSIDLVYIDPPFSTNKIFKNKNNELCFKDKYTLQELIEFLTPRIMQIHRILKDTGSFYLHGDYRFIPYMRIICDKIFDIKNFRNEIVWCYGAGKSKNKIFATKHDTILFYSKTDNYKFNELKDEKTGARIKDYWLIKSIADKSGYLKKKDDTEKFLYPTQKPVELLERIILSSTCDGDIVLDPFMGSGTTLEAAKKLNRKYIGIDSSEISYKTVKERLND